MADNDKCTGVLDVAYDTVVLGFNLVGSEVPNLPSRLTHALQSENLQAALKDALNEVAQSHLKDQAATLSEKEAKEFARKIITAGGTAVGDSVVSQIKSSPKFQQLEKRAQELLTSLRCSPVGVWYDKNEKWVYIVAAGAALSGTVALYVTRAGDALTQPVMSVVKDKPLKFKSFGKLEISGQLTRFVPSKREVELKVFAAVKLEPVKAKFSVTAQAVGTDVKAVGSGQILIPLSRGVISTFEGTVDSKERSYSLGLGVDFSPDSVRLNLLANIKDSKFSGGSLDLSAKGIFKPLDLKAGVTGKIDSQSGGYTIMGTITGRF